MKLKTTYIFIVTLFLLSCSTAVNDSPDAFAQKFCTCSEKMGKSIVQLKNGLISQKEYDVVRREHEKCMGPYDPRQDMSPTDVEKFDLAFIKAIFEKCPSTARNYGFKD